MKTIKNHLLLVSVIMCMLFLVFEISRAQPLSTPAEMLAMIVTVGWLALFWYAQIR